MLLCADHSIENHFIFNRVDMLIEAAACLLHGKAGLVLVIARVCAAKPQVFGLKYGVEIYYCLTCLEFQLRFWWRGLHTEQKQGGIGRRTNQDSRGIKSLLGQPIVLEQAKYSL